MVIYDEDEANHFELVGAGVGAGGAMGALVGALSSLVMDPITLGPAALFGTLGGVLGGAIGGAVVMMLDWISGPWY